ncbi:MAG: putative quinol monooxygenase [Caulobacter sp.]|nr:putative quinol monooxygenase [Caulobacter sp.]
MVIVTGEILAKPDTREDLIALCIEHSRRSRAEPGCVSHDSFVDTENPMRIFFFERWADRPSLEAHFAVPESNAFMRQVRALAAGGSRGPDICEIPPI